MSQPNPEAERIEWLHEIVDEYCDGHTGESADKPYFHEAIDNKEKQKELGDMWECFMEYADEMNNYCDCGNEGTLYNGCCEECI